MKKWLVSLLTLVLLLTALPLQSSAAASVVSDWARRYVSDAEMYQILPESLAGGDYTKSITRLEFGTLAFETLSNATELSLSGEPSSFEDCSSAEIASLYSIGVIKGRSSTTFAPNDTITREEAATILGRMADYMGLTRFPNQLTYGDWDTVSLWAKDEVTKVTSLCIMNGMENGNFTPRGQFTREQAITTMVRILENIPFLDVVVAVDEEKTFQFNNFYLWIADDSDVLFALPMSQYGALEWFTRDSKLTLLATTRDFQTECIAFDSKALLFTIPYPVYEVNEEKQVLITFEVNYEGDNVDSAFILYGVYDFDGKEILPTNSTYQDLVDLGYAIKNEESSNLTEMQ
jgi:hypothetical protein